MGPIIVVLCIFIGLVTCIQDGGNVAAGLDVIRDSAYARAEGGETIKNAGANWFYLCCIYAGFVLLWFASFTAALGSKNKKKISITVLSAEPLQYVAVV